MIIRASYSRHVLEFAKPARTSRGEMQAHTVYYVRLQQGQRTGLGEAAPLPGLSIDAVNDLEEKLALFCTQVNEGMHPLDADLDRFPSIRFAFESALKTLQHDDAHLLFDTDFVKGKGIPINGLVWMDTPAAMLEQAAQKMEAGFSCIKFKVGALDFDEECRMLERFRKQYSAFRAEIRLDANGAFKTAEALEQLKELSRFDIHSIEQPIKAGQHGHMQELCARSKIAIALDEELIGVPVSESQTLLATIRPQYLILKPTLLGGFAYSEAWIRSAESMDIGWWATSALESNIGLNAIAQWTSAMKTRIPQGLGTGSLYTNNIASPLVVKNGMLWYDVHKSWERTP